jgi:protein-disulfide isomerase
MRNLPLLLLIATVACASGPRAVPESTIPKPAPEGEGRAPDLSLSVEGDEGDGVERLYAITSSERAPRRGPDDAKVTLAVCSDFECPFCARLKPTLDELEQNYGELVRIEWRNCPLPFHDNALPAAEAAMEVYAQAGDAAFWSYHDKLFAHQDALAGADLVEYARDIEGVKPEGVAEALADHRHVPRIAKDLSAIAESGAASRGFGTPATFINGRLLSGAQPYELFEDAVERALAETPEARAQAQANSDAAYPMARVRHILIQWQGAQGSNERVTRTKDQAFALAQRLRDQVVEEKADMAELAQQNSDCPSAPEGGELGRFTRGELVPEFESAMFTLAVGQVSNVVETPFGYHVILREE